MSKSASPNAHSQQIVIVCEVLVCTSVIAMTERRSSKRSSQSADVSAEERLVRIIHRKVGGPAALSTYDDPAGVREVVIAALAAEQSTPADARRVRMGDLTGLERRVVRTVTNRGAAVRSRMRQKRELSRLREELKRKDTKVRQLEEALAKANGNGRDPCSVMPENSRQEHLSEHRHKHHNSRDGRSHKTQAYRSMQSIVANQQALSRHQSMDRDDRIHMKEGSVDRDMFGNIIDQMLAIH